MVTPSLYRSSDRSNLIQTKLYPYVQLSTSDYYLYVNHTKSFYLTKIKFFYLDYLHKINLLNIKKERTKKCALCTIKIHQYFDDANHNQLRGVLKN